MRKKLYSNGIISNYISIIIMAVSGLFMNTVIALLYDSAAVGVFNETYAWYMILSQVSVFGIHMAVTKCVPEEDMNKTKQDILTASIIIVSLTSMIVIGISETILYFFNTMLWQKSLMYALPGLLMFSINKVLLNYLNATYKFVWHAIGQSLRYILITVVILGLSFLGVEEVMLSLTFVVSETIVTAFLLVVVKVNLVKCITNCFRYIPELLGFGARIFPSNIVTELNTKVDIICLSLLAIDNASIGVYSFAILFTEGFYMLFITVRRIINPGISEANKKGLLNEYLAEQNRGLLRYSVVWSVLAFCAVCLVYYIASLVLGKETYLTGYIYISVICISIIINGKRIIWGDLLGQTGYPTAESRVNVITVASNAILNIIFIFVVGTTGAAVATGLSHFVFNYIQKYEVQKKIGIKI